MLLEGETSETYKGQTTVHKPIPIPNIILKILKIIKVGEKAQNNALKKEIQDIMVIDYYNDHY